MCGSRKVCQIGSRLGPTLRFLFVLVDEGREDPNTTISGPSLADDGLILNAIFQGNLTRIAKKPLLDLRMITDKKDPY